jgi:DNA-binding PadR family transcriptional regulator
MKKTPNEEQRIAFPSGKEAIILELLLGNSSREKYGLELVRDSANRLKRGTIYVTLDRMETKGLVQSRLEHEKTDERSLPRRLYRVTGVGQRAFEAWQMARQAFSLQSAVNL